MKRKPFRMESHLPYINIDDEFDFNSSLLLLLIDKLAYSTKNAPKLDFNKIQFFLYLLKNPSKINIILEYAGKKHTDIEDTQIYTIESLAVNVDILHDRSKLKSLIRRLASIGALDVSDNQKTELFYILTPDGKDLALKLSSGYFVTLLKHIDNIKPLLSVPTPRLLSVLNQVFKGNI